MFSKTKKLFELVPSWSKAVAMFNNCPMWLWFKSCFCLSKAVQMCSEKQSIGPTLIKKCHLKHVILNKILKLEHKQLEEATSSQNKSWYCSVGPYLSNFVKGQQNKVKMCFFRAQNNFQQKIIFEFCQNFNKFLGTFGRKMKIFFSCSKCVSEKNRIWKFFEIFFCNFSKKCSKFFSSNVNIWHRKRKPLTSWSFWCITHPTSLPNLG